jgi:hypothetical protein
VTSAEDVVITTAVCAIPGGAFPSRETVRKVEQIHPTAALALVGSVGHSVLPLRPGSPMRSEDECLGVRNACGQRRPWRPLRRHQSRVDPDRPTLIGSPGHGRTDDAYRVFTINLPMQSPPVPSGTQSSTNRQR